MNNDDESSRGIWYDAPNCDVQITKKLYYYVNSNNLFSIFIAVDIFTLSYVCLETELMNE